MARALQLSLPSPRTWGGRRTGAGRKLTPGRRPSVPHHTRPAHVAAHPVHVTLRSGSVHCLRADRVFPAVRRALAAASHRRFRILHFTVQVRYLNLTGRSFVDFTDPEKRHDIFKMMVVGFNNIWVSGFYILGMALLTLHLSHGASSMFQSIGWKNRAYGPVLDKLARIGALVIFLGYSSIPVAILCGYGRGQVK